jgi:glycolate oxidase iron-sulfur subunit
MWVRGVARVLADTAPRAASLPALTPARGTRRLRAGFLEGCVSRWVYGHVNEAATRLLTASGTEVVAPAGQGCCGALHLHSGDRAGARRLAKANIEAFEKAGALDAIVVTAAGCGSAMKEYGALFEGDPAWQDRAERFAAGVRDALELLAEIGLPPVRREVQATVAYQDACHLAHAQGIRAQPRALLASIPGVTLVPLEGADRCCGSAGIYNLLHPDVASAILQQKIKALRASGATVVAAANPGCLLQIAGGARQAGLPLRVVHPLEILDDACR